MSLFDVLRYPISDIPTEDEFNSLPKNLYNDWGHRVGWDPIWTVGSVISFYSAHMQSSPNQDIILLRKMIKEYDEPI